MADKLFTYSPFEFFYDKSFKDYVQSNYFFIFRELFKNQKQNPQIVVKHEQLFILSHKPEYIVLNECVGILDANMDANGIYGSYRFIDSTMGNLLNELYLEGIYKFAPIGNALFDNRGNVVYYELDSVYLKNVRR